MLLLYNIRLLMLKELLEVQVEVKVEVGHLLRLPSS